MICSLLWKCVFASCIILTTATAAVWKYKQDTYIYHSKMTIKQQLTWQGYWNQIKYTEY